MRAVIVEQSAGNPSCRSFHAVFSVGTVVGSLVGAGTLAAALRAWPVRAIPQVFTAAGNLGSAIQFSRVVGCGYAAFLAGPALIGWLAEAVTLRLALAVPLLAVVVCALGANAVRRPMRPGSANMRSEATDPCTQ
jgi:hypothetical protein